MWDESEGGGGYIWLLMITLPLGALWFVLASLVNLYFKNRP